MDTLAKKNPHPRDDRIVFEDEGHRYFVDGKPGYMSTTTFIHDLFEKFDADKIIKKMMGSVKWSQSPYYGKSPDEIKNEWEVNRDDAATRGTEMHLNIEKYYNGVEHDTSSKEWRLFREYERDHVEGKLIPYRTEMLVFAEDLEISGSIDMLYRDAVTGEFVMADWKRSKAIRIDNKWQKGSHFLVSSLDDCNLVHYSLQQGIYSYILRRYYDMPVRSRHLVVLHPNQETYLRIPCTDLDGVIERLLEDRREEISLKKYIEHN